MGKLNKIGMWEREGKVKQQKSSWKKGREKRKENIFLFKMSQSTFSIMLRDFSISFIEAA